MTQEVIVKKRPLSEATKTALLKLSAPEAVSIMEDMQNLAGDNQNQNNNN